MDWRPADAKNRFSELVTRALALPKDHNGSAVTMTPLS